MTTNYLLSKLGAETYASLLSRAHRLRFERETVLSEPESPIGRVLFPLSGMISVVVELADGPWVECAMIGAGGALGGLAAFGAERHTATAICQMAGECWSVPMAVVAEVAEHDRGFRRLLLRQEQFLRAQAQHTAACNARHTIAERLAGWILRSRDAIGSDQVLLTQERMAQMLGVQRASVSMAASSLSSQGAIEYTRGKIRIVDANKLADTACECHQGLKRCHRSLFEETPSHQSGQDAPPAVRH